MTTTYATATALVDADWAQAHLDDSNVRFVEVDVDTTSYEQSHLPGAVGWNWTSQLADGVRRDIASREDFSALLSASGIGPGTTIVLYGDNNNWFAAWAYWQLKLYGHEDVRILDGGRKYWLDNGLPITEFANFRQLGPNDQGESLLQTYLDMKPEDGKQPLSLMPQSELLYKNLQADQGAIDAIQGWLNLQ
jgi:3-mercaptopyruvate sulfurtransferase SseA